MFDVERGLDADVPFLRNDAAEVVDELAVKQRFATAEGHSAACGKEVEVVNGHVFIQFLRCHGGIGRCVGEALRIEAILATKRTAVEGHERGDALSVGGDAVAFNADERCFHVRKSMFFIP